MKRFQYGTACKSAAFILFLISFVTAVWSLLGVVYMAEEGYYNSGFSFDESELCRGVTNDYINKVVLDYFPLTRKSGLDTAESVRMDNYRSEFKQEATNFSFAITDETGHVLLNNYDNPPPGVRENRYFIIRQELTAERYNITYSVKAPISAPDAYQQPYGLFLSLSSMRYTAVLLASLSAPIAVGLLVFLMYAAGRRKGSDGIILTWQHAIPLDLLAALLILAGFLASRLLENASYSRGYAYGFIILLPASVVLLVFSACALAFCMNVSVRIKKGKWWRNTVIYRILSFTAGVVNKLFKRLPMIWKAALLIAGYLLVNSVMTAAYLSVRSGFAVLLWLVFNFAVFAALSCLLFQMKTIMRAGAQLAGGDYAGRIDTEKMVWELKQHAENLNNIGAGMSKAVDARMKSERLKTELITNVSHDLKTPLTSIISYIDLLKKENAVGDTAAEYIAVLDRQSSRLKKLTEDLLEASKAATGNITVSFENTDLVELVNQSVGEYTERFEASGLTVVFGSGREHAAVYADGKILWRVFDNLLNNICKYSLPGTRVYISVDAGDDTAKVSFLNISRYALNIDAGELMERFVRGDASRSTDGSGLGLSIAKSLTEIQNGSFELLIDGDLFKTVIKFKSLLS